jgi:L-fucose isomerase-like protein
LDNPRIGFVTCLHPVYSLPAVVQHRDAAITALREAGCDVVAPPTARDPGDISRIVEELRKADIDLLLFFFCTWVAEEITLSIAQELADTPLLLWALPYLDLSVPMPSPMTGITATGCNLTRIGRRYLHKVGAVTPFQIQAVITTARNAAAIRRLRLARFGIFGSPCPGMVDTACDESLLQKLMGFTTIRFEIDDLLRARDASSAQEALRLAKQLEKRIGRSEVSLETISEQCRLFLGMKSLVQKYELDGFSVRCWPELRDHHKATICLAMAKLAESGIASACESDVTALVTSFILNSITGRPSCTLEITAQLDEQNALQMAHCGVAAMSLAGNPKPTIRSHMRTGEGALIEFGFKPGLVTIAKVLRPFETGMKMFISRGEIIPTDRAMRGTTATVRVEPSPAQFLQSMLQNAVEHHLVLTYGDWTENLEEFAHLAGIECISPSYYSSAPWPVQHTSEEK